MVGDASAASVTTSAISLTSCSFKINSVFEHTSARMESGWLAGFVKVYWLESLHEVTWCSLEMEEACSRLHNKTTWLDLTIKITGRIKMTGHVNFWFLTGRNTKSFKSGVWVLGNQTLLLVSHCSTDQQLVAVMSQHPGQSINNDGSEEEDWLQVHKDVTDTQLINHVFLINCRFAWMKVHRTHLTVNVNVMLI